MNPLIDLINKRSLKKSIPDIKTGDIVKVSQKIKEGNKTRAQVFEGMVISREGGNSVTACITVRKIASGVGVEKKFLLNSPNVESVKVLRSSKVKRSKIFFLRGLTGKAAKIKEKQRKMMEEIGLKEDEIIETAETTEDLAQPVKEEEIEGKLEERNLEEIKEESPVEVIEAKTGKTEVVEGVEVSDEAVEQQVEKVAEEETPIEENKDEPVVENTNEEKTE